MTSGPNPFCRKLTGCLTTTCLVGASVGNMSFLGSISVTNLYLNKLLIVIE